MTHSNSADASSAALSPLDEGIQYAQKQDQEDPLAKYRSEFIIPSKADLVRSTLQKPSKEPDSPPSIYLCGNSLGCLPRRLRQRVETHFTQWATKGVMGHFVSHDDSSLSPFLDIDDQAAGLMAPLVGAHQDEVVVMDTLTANLHFLMASFYRPTPQKHKILLEGKAFPSDHYAVESQILHHGFKPSESMILLHPISPAQTLTMEQIRATIDENAGELALILLPGIQFYTGQLFDIKSITEYAHARAITIGWDLAHAAGNVELKLHEWDVDFAAWCTYKYLNAGPGSCAGLFVHEKHGKVDMSAPQGSRFRQRLTGWWGADKATRFLMNNQFVPRGGAAGFQVSNPNILGVSAVIGALELFNEAGMPAIRQKSLKITRYLEVLLENLQQKSAAKHMPSFEIITPAQADERGAQLSIKLSPNVLDRILAYLEENGVVIDERKPDVIRVAPAPLYNTYEDVWHFCEILHKALIENSEGGPAPTTDHGISKSGS